MVDFLNYMASLIQISVKTLLKLIEKITCYKHHMAFINMYFCFSLSQNTKGILVQVSFNIPNLQVLKILSSKKLVFKIGSNHNSYIRGYLMIYCIIKITCTLFTLMNQNNS